MCCKLTSMFYFSNTDTRAGYIYNTTTRRSGADEDVHLQRMRGEQQQI